MKSNQSFTGLLRARRTRRAALALIAASSAGAAFAQDQTPAAPAAAAEVEAAPVDAAAEAAAAPAAAPETAAVTAAEPSELAQAPHFETLVTARKPMTAASSLTVRDRDFLLRPHTRPADILMVTPGLFVGQHAGGGKANQYFLRGFDADHGTDVALSVDGIPVNLLSHGHGQGYADLHWLIPEVVERIEASKGPYFAEHGDLATAGAINLVTRGGYSESQLSLSGGMLKTYRGLLVASPQLEDWRPFFAAEVYGTDGPFDNAERLKRYNLFSKVTRDFGASGSWSFALTSYAGGWRASGQIPLREVRAGRLDRFASIDASEGGNSQRHSVYTSYRLQPSEDSELLLLAYLAQYRLALFSNFTFFSADTDNGDMIEQNDVRTLSGLRGSYRFVERLGSVSFDTTLGIQMRSDLIENALHNAVLRERTGTLVDAEVREGSLAVYGQEEIQWTPWLRSIAGLRFDYFGFDVKDKLEDLATLGTRTSGVRQATQISPKASLVLSPLPEWDMYLNFGVGFHSNDARGVVRGSDPVTPLTRAVGEEIGSRLRLFDRLDLAVSFFALHLDSETVWVGDAGTTEARGPTQRYGVEAEARLEVLPWLFADADATLSRATFTENAGNANAVALAPRFLTSGGVSARHPSGLYGRLGVLHIADRPATEDEFLTADGFTRVDATAGYKHDRFELSLAVENLFDTEWREAQFANVSRLPGETSAADCPAGTRAAEDVGNFLGCEDLHFTPGAPINVQATATFYF